MQALEKQKRMNKSSKVAVPLNRLVVEVKSSGGAEVSNEKRQVSVVEATVQKQGIVSEKNGNIPNTVQNQMEEASAAQKQPEENAAVA